MAIERKPLKCLVFMALVILLSLILVAILRPGSVSEIVLLIICIGLVGGIICGFHVMWKGPGKK
jgi:hypothetical protein